MDLALIFVLNLSLIAGPQDLVASHAGRPLSDWLKDLESGDDRARLAAIQAVQAMGPKARSAVPSLISVLKAEPGSLDIEAARALGAIGPEAREAAPALVARLKANTRSYRYSTAAGEALARIDGANPEATRALLLETNPRCGGLLLYFASYPRTHPQETVRQLLALIRDRDPLVRERAALALGGQDNLVGIGTVKPSEILANAGPLAKEIPDALVSLLADPVWAVRYAAIQSIQAVAPDRAEAYFPVVVDAIRAGEVSLIKAKSGSIAAGLLSPFPEKAFTALIPVLDGPDPYAREEAIAVLAHLPIAPLAEQTLREAKTARVRAASATILARSYSVMSLPVLSSAVKDNDFEVRYAAAVAIAEIGRDSEIRYAAGLAIAGIGREPQAGPAIPALIEALRDGRVEVRQGAALALRLTGSTGKPAVPMLKEKTHDPEPNVRVAAALALVAVDRLDSVEAVAPLAEALDGKARTNSLEIVEALIQIGPLAKPAIPALKTWFSSPNPRMKARSAEAVARIDPEQVGPAIVVLLEMISRKQGRDRDSAVSSLIRVGPAAKSAVPRLVEILQDPRTASAGPALAILAIDPASGKPALDWIHQKLKNGPDDDHANDLVREMGKLGPAAKPLVPELIALLKSPSEYFRSSAARALGLVGPEAADALPALREAAKSDPDEVVRLGAVESIRLIESR
jgi:HEAT repeat protein